MFLQAHPFGWQRGALTISKGMHLAFSVPASAYSHSCSGSADPASHSTWACPRCPSGCHSQAPTSSARLSLGMWPHGLQGWWVLALRALFLLPVKSSCPSQLLWPTALWIPCWET